MITVGEVPGTIKTISNEGVATVSDACHKAGINLGFQTNEDGETTMKEIKLNGVVVDKTATVKNEDVILVSRKIKSGY